MSKGSLSLLEFNELIGRDSYVLCRGKERIDKDIYDMDTAERHIYRGGSIGWWVRPGFIVVDVDEGKEQAKEMLKALGIKTLVAETVKGLHIYFKSTDFVKQGQGMTLPCGLKCDTRSADKGYVILPYGMKDRRFNKIREIADLPLELTPIVKMKDSLLGLAEGDGRNEKTFRQLAAYRNQGASEEQVEQMAEIINTVIFSEPMEDRELEKIIHNAQNAKDMSGNPYLLMNAKGTAYTSIFQPAIRDFFINRGDTFVVGDRIYCYRDGIYRYSQLEIRNSIEPLIIEDAKHLCNDEKFTSVIRFVNKSPELIRNVEDFDRDTHRINFKNGIWDTEKKELISHDPMYLHMIQIPHEVKESKGKLKDTRIFKFLSERCNLPEDDIDMILDFMAYSLTTDNSLKSFIALHGPTNTGKTILINFIRKLVGEHNTSSLTMANFNERFMPAELFGKILNAAGDESAKALEDISFLKKVTGEDTIKAEFKGQKPFDFKPFAKLIFSFNQLPLQLEEKSGAFYGRMRILHMGRELRGITNSYVKDLHSKEAMEEVIPHLLNRMPLEAIPNSVKSNTLKEQLRQDSDSVHAFIKRKCTLAKNVWVVKKSLYQSYVSFCSEQGREPHKLHAFNRHIKEKFKDGRSPKGDYVWKGLELSKKKR